MFNRLCTIFLLGIMVILVVGENSYSGDKTKKHFSQEAKLVSPEVEQEWEARLNAYIESGAVMKKPHRIFPSTNTVFLTDTIGKTTYDFGANATLGRRIALSRGDVAGGQADGIHFGYMLRTTGSNTTRFATYDFYDRSFGLFFGPHQFLSYAGSGWASVVDGTDHEVLTAFHWTDPTTTFTTTRFARDDAQAIYSFSTDVEVDPAGLWPGFTAKGDTVFLTNTQHQEPRVPGKSFYSLDYGLTWTQSGYPTPPSAGAVQFESVECSPEFNPVNPMEIGFSTIQEEAPQNGGTTYQGGIAWSTTQDLGATWSSNTVFDFGTILPGNYTYLPRIPGATTYYNLGQITFWTHEFGTYGDDGTAHVVFNGNGFQVEGPDTFNIFPVVYWNSQHQQLIELTADSVARNPAISDTVVDVAVWASVGNAWPHIAVGPDNLVAAVWQQMEMVDNSNLRIVLGSVSGVPTTPFVASDIYCAVSSDNGASWTEPFKVGGEIGECDIYPMVAREIEKDANDNYFLHLMYLWDTNPGISLNDGTEFSECAWIYNMVDITNKVVTSIDDDDAANIVENYGLEQNYPNPFNPRTQIKFSIAKPQDVKLVVYNLLGEEISTLLSEKKLAGEYTVEFDASHLSSGLYFYTLSTAEFKETRKMVLMR